jgi:hypothetical protein
MDIGTVAIRRGPLLKTSTPQIQILLLIPQAFLGAKQ